MNLLLDPWIPIVRRGGRRELIAPWQASEGADTDDPPLRVDAPRGDLEVACIEFLVATLQTYWRPETPRDWRRAFDRPPDPRDIRGAFIGREWPWRLDGPGPRALQALDVIADAEAGAPIASLLVNVGQANAVSENRTALLPDLAPSALCVSCAACALYARQTTAPPAGGGFRASLRGPLPLSTLIVGATLWETVWLNVLDSKYWDALAFGARPGASDEDRFLWLSETRHEPVTPADLAPEAVLWPLATRCAVHFEGSGTCDLCGAESLLLARKWMNRQHGTNYQPSSWPTPVSPRRKKQDAGEYTPTPSDRDLTYLDWLGIALSEASEYARCAPVVQALLTEKSRQARAGIRLRVYGNAGKQAKVLRWVDSTWPVIVCEPEHRAEFERYARLYAGATHVAGKKLFAAGKANEQPIGVHQLAARTEACFLSTLESTRRALVDGDSTLDLREEWRQFIAIQTLEIYDRAIRPGGLGADRMRRYADARSKLVRALFGKPLAEVLELSTNGKETAC